MSKIIEFQKEFILISDFAKVLSHPARLEIIQILADKKSCICGEIVEVMPLSQSTVSQHLKELKRIGLIKGEIEGKKSCYCLDWDKLAEYNQILNQRMNQILDQNNAQIKCC